MPWNIGSTHVGKAGGSGTAGSVGPGLGVVPQPCFSQRVVVEISRSVNKLWRPGGC